jgi:hypothetical protein
MAPPACCSGTPAYRVVWGEDVEIDATSCTRYTGPALLP